jgi:menaquinone-specific isochorismate synthase
MNPSQIVQLIQEQISSLINKKLDSDYCWYNLLFKIPAIQLSQINWSECDYYQSLSGKDNHLHAYGICEQYHAEAGNLNGENRVQQLDRLYKKFIQQCLFVNETSKPINNIPLAYCHVAFDQTDKMSGVWQGFDNAKLVIPQIIFLHQNQQTQIIIFIKKETDALLNIQLDKLFSSLSIILRNNNKNENHSIENKVQAINIVQQQAEVSSQTKQQYKNQIHNIKLQLQSNTVSKIVLARQANFQFSNLLNIRKLILTLLTTYPDCTIMMLKSDQSYLIACSPEQLVKVSKQRVYCDTVGGTINNNQSEIQNTKLKHEHIIIREHIHDILKQFCHNIEFSEQPSIKNYLHLSHLYTYFSATTKKPLSVLQMAAALHPTPAVCGIPVQQAKNWIIENETFNRGLYSGFSGWLDAFAEGEMNVILRCAVLEESYKQREEQRKKQRDANNNPLFTATLFAGAGIVKGSIDEDEWQETELKFKMLLSAIQQVHQHNANQLTSANSI